MREFFSRINEGGGGAAAVEGMFEPQDARAIRFARTIAWPLSEAALNLHGVNLGAEADTLLARVAYHDEPYLRNMAQKPPESYTIARKTFMPFPLGSYLESYGAIVPTSAPTAGKGHMETLGKTRHSN
ncbi:hypothetical protein CMUS01_10437 [Colletotrichum musicola]|uniref:Uncharacterized protein n=1 Tax=Colletotrichum musicola TaxID=2175873 RepID=A0A8H6N885_9PEZI|nr:hypothetical protein CMUS01_10437 [Colletotrichum musicola]